MANLRHPAPTASSTSGEITQKTSSRSITPPHIVSSLISVQSCSGSSEDEYGQRNQVCRAAKGSARKSSSHVALTYPTPYIQRHGIHGPALHRYGRHVTPHRAWGPPGLHDLPPRRKQRRRQLVRRALLRVEHAQHLVSSPQAETDPSLSVRPFSLRGTRTTISWRYPRMFATPRLGSSGESLATNGNVDPAGPVAVAYEASAYEASSAHAC